MGVPFYVIFITMAFDFPCWITNAFCNCMDSLFTVLRHEQTLQYFSLRGTKLLINQNICLRKLRQKSNQACSIKIFIKTSINVGYMPLNFENSWQNFFFSRFRETCIFIHFYSWYCGKAMKSKLRLEVHLISKLNMRLC